MKRANSYKSFWSSMGRRGPMNTQSRPSVTQREIEAQCPGSVYKSLLDGANWIDTLDISPRAKRLTRLQGRQFLQAVENILSHRSRYTHGSNQR